MQRRVRTKLRFDPKGDDRVPSEYVLVRTDTPECRRTDRELWRREPDKPEARTELATLSRRQVAELIADGAEWLAYGGDGG